MTTILGEVRLAQQGLESLVGDSATVLGALGMVAVALYGLYRVVRHDRQWQQLLAERRKNETDLQKKVRSLERQLNHGAERRRELHKKITDLERERDDWHRDRADFEAKVRELEQQRQQWMTQYAELESRFVDVEAALGAVMRIQEEEK